MSHCRDLNDDNNDVRLIVCVSRIIYAGHTGEGLERSVYSSVVLQRLQVRSMPSSAAAVFQIQP